MNITNNIIHYIDYKIKRENNISLSINNSTAWAYGHMC